MVHGRAKDAERIVTDIEEKVRAHKGPSRSRSG